MPHPLRRVAAVVLWTLLWLAVIDGVLNGVCDPRWAPRLHTQSLSRYFDYGRSIEGKLGRMLGPLADQPNAVVQAGWIDPAQWQATLAAAPRPGSDLLVAVYGQSFAFNAAEAWAERDGRLTLRLIGGPAAPLSHSYAAYRADDASTRHADVVVVGILASSVPKMDSMSGLSWTFESPAPFTFPQFVLRGGQLEETAPLISTEQAFRAAFAAQGAPWQAFTDQLRGHDQGFDAFAFFHHPLLDASSLLRLVRRGWVASRQHYDLNPAVPGGSDPGGQLAVARALLSRVQQQAAANHERLVVVLFQDRGAEVNLRQALGPTLASLNVACLSSEQFFSSNDPANFIADGHYTERANGLIAEALGRVVRAGQGVATCRE